MRRNTKGAWFGGGEIFLFIVGLGIGSGVKTGTESVSELEPSTIGETAAVPAKETIKPLMRDVSSMSEGEASRPPVLTQNEKLQAGLAGMSLGELRVALENRRVRFENTLERVFPVKSESSSRADFEPPTSFREDLDSFEGTMEFSLDDRLVVLLVKMQRGSLLTYPKGDDLDPRTGEFATALVGGTLHYTIQAFGGGKTAHEGKSGISGILWTELRERDGKQWFVGTFSHERLDEFGYALFFERPSADEMGRFEIVLDEKARQIKSGLIRWRTVAHQGKQND